MNKFFKNREIIEGDIVDLRFKYYVDEYSASDGIPTVYFYILNHETKKRIGNIDLRLKMNRYMYYYGHIGYDISKENQGHNYSYYACKMMFEIACNKYGLKELLLTCNPENIASYKVLKKLGGELMEIVDVPKNHELYRLGDYRKCIFRFNLDEHGKD